MKGIVGSTVVVLAVVWTLAAQAGADKKNAAAGKSPGSVQGRAGESRRDKMARDIGLRTDFPEWEEDRCCYPAHELELDAIPQAACRRTRWTTAAAGVCSRREAPGQACLHNSLTTVVTLHEYQLNWSTTTSRCEKTPTGNSHNVTVDNCLGDECD